MMTINKNDPAWFAAREALWENKVKEFLLKTFRKKDLKLLKSIFMGDLYPDCSQAAYDADTEFLEMCHEREVPAAHGFFLWPEQTPAAWEKYYKDCILGGSKWKREDWFLHIVPLHVDPREYGWDDATEREWTLHTLASLFRGYVEGAPKPFCEFPQIEIASAISSWAGAVFGYLNGSPYYVDVSDEPSYLNLNDRPLRATTWMLKALRQVPDDYFDDSSVAADAERWGGGAGRTCASG